MKIVYSSTIDDVIAYNELMISSRVDIKNNARYGLLIFVLLSFAFISFVFDITKGLVDQYRWPIRAITCCFFAWLALPRKKQKKMLREKFYKSIYEGKNALGAFGKFCIELTEKEFRVIGEGSEEIYQLSRVTEILNHDNYAIIKTGHNAHVIPRAQVEQGSLQELLSALQAIGVPNSNLTEAKADRIQPGLYVFIAAAISFVITLLSYVTADTSNFIRFGKCFTDATFNSFSGCFSKLSTNESAFASLAILFVTLFVTSIRMFYKNWKNVRQRISAVK